jgi:hypothetical protein
VLIDNLELFLSSSPATIEVPRDFPTIQDAINAASYGDIVQVSPGTYTGDGNRDIDFKGKSITVRSSSGSGQTIIDCSGGEGHRGFYFHTGEGRDSVLRGFTVRGAVFSGSKIPPENSSWSPSPTHPVGGGVFCEFASPSIIDCLIEQCSAELGGGIACVGGSPLIYDCAVEQCRAEGFGAGVALIRNSEPLIVNSTIRNNIGSGNTVGGGLYCLQSSFRLAGSDISFNSSPGNITGGGIYCAGSSTEATLEHCIISNNAGSGIFSESYADLYITNCTVADNVAEGVYAESSYVVVRNSIVWYNDGSAVVLNGSLSSSPVLYSNIQGSYPGQGNIDAEPMFTSANDYHLLSGFSSGGVTAWGNHSPCIDAGNPQDPVGAEPFPNNGRINMGAYGGTIEASRSTGPLIIHVDGSGLYRNQAFRTIQEAVEWAADGDTVMVWPGVYHEAVFVEGKAITIQSADDAAVVKAPPNDIAFTFQYAENLRSVLRNFVITDCETAIVCYGGSPELTNLTIVNNQFGIAAYEGSDPSISNCIIWNNELGDLEQCRARYSCLGSLEAGEADPGNISKDPLFADVDHGDYHLQSEYGRYVPGSRSCTTDSQTSPCIDGGDPAMHTGREQKPHRGRVNMGAYGGTPFASKSGPSW